MSTDAPEETKPAKKPGLVKRLLNLPKQVTPAGCASCLTSIFLVALVVAVWVVFFLDPNNVPWRHSMSWTRIAIQVLLVFVIPVVLYRALQLWLEGDKSQFPDIDYAWRSGIEALQRNGLSIRSAPLFLVLGSTGPRQEQSLVRASSLALRVSDVPEGPAPVHWYANPEGIYLFCTEASWSGALAALIEKRRAESGGEGDTEMARATPMVAPPQPASSAKATGRWGATPSESGRGTIMLDQFMADVQNQAQPDQADAAGTIDEGASISLPQMSDDVTLSLAPHESAEQVQRLHYVCQLIRQSRAPLCPINGLLTLVPFELLQARPRQAQELQKAVRNDLITIQGELRQRCPVTALVVGMQNERGFREIVRRVGRQRAAAQRFGRQFDVRMLPTPDLLGNLCVHVCGVFEDWIHTLFREAGALSRPGNTRLYALLCKIRVNMQNTLRDFLSGAYAYDEQQKDLEEPLAFSGCYFAATGETEDQQAFVKGVFDKLAEEQEEVEWTRRAVRTNRRYRGLSLANLLIGGALAIGLTVLAVQRLVF